jgi:hypothetical protein
MIKFYISALMVCSFFCPLYASSHTFKSHYHEDRWSGEKVIFKVKPIELEKNLDKIVRVPLSAPPAPVLRETSFKKRKIETPAENVTEAPKKEIASSQSALQQTNPTKETVEIDEEAKTRLFQQCSLNVARACFKLKDYKNTIIYYEDVLLHPDMLAKEEDYYNAATANFELKNYMRAALFYKVLLMFPEQLTMPSLKSAGDASIRAGDHKEAAMLYKVCSLYFYNIYKEKDSFDPFCSLQVKDPSDNSLLCNEKLDKEKTLPNVELPSGKTRISSS